MGTSKTDPSPSREGAPTHGVQAPCRALQCLLSFIYFSLFWFCKAAALSWLSLHPFRWRKIKKKWNALKRMPWGVARPRGYSEWAPFGVLVIINYLLKPDYVPGATKAKKRQGPFPGSFPGEERTVLAAKKGFHLKIQWHVTAQGCSMPLLYFYFQWCSFIFLSKSNKVYKIFLQDREKIKLNSIFYHTF